MEFSVFINRKTGPSIIPNIFSKSVYKRRTNLYTSADGSRKAIFEAMYQPFREVIFDIAEAVNNDPDSEYNIDIDRLQEILNNRDMLYERFFEGASRLWESMTNRRTGETYQALRSNPTNLRRLYKLFLQIIQDEGRVLIPNPRLATEEQEGTIEEDVREMVEEQQRTRIAQYLVDAFQQYGMGGNVGMGVPVAGMVEEPLVVEVPTLEEAEEEPVEVVTQEEMATAVDGEVTLTGPQEVVEQEEEIEAVEEGGIGLEEEEEGEEEAIQEDLMERLVAILRTGTILSEDQARIQASLIMAEATTDEEVIQMAQQIVGYPRVMAGTHQVVPYKGDLPGIGGPSGPYGIGGPYGMGGFNNPIDGDINVDEYLGASRGVEGRFNQIGVVGSNIIDVLTRYGPSIGASLIGGGISLGVSKAYDIYRGPKIQAPPVMEYPREQFTPKPHIDDLFDFEISTPPVKTVLKESSIKDPIVKISTETEIEEEIEETEEIPRRQISMPIGLLIVASLIGTASMLKYQNQNCHE